MLRPVFIKTDQSGSGLDSLIIFFDNVRTSIKPVKWY